MRRWRTTFWHFKASSTAALGVPVRSKRKGPDGLLTGKALDLQLLAGRDRQVKLQYRITTRSIADMRFC